MSKDFFIIFHFFQNFLRHQLNITNDDDVTSILKHSKSLPSRSKPQKLAESEEESDDQEVRVKSIIGLLLTSTSATANSALINGNRR